jgi:hypothetical protein
VVRERVANLLNRETRRKKTIMKITTTKKLNFSDVWKTRNVRSDLADRIEKYWLNNPKSLVGLQYLQLVEGVISVRKSCCERTDVLLFQVPSVCNVFMGVDGSVDVQYWDGVETSDEEHEEIKAAARQFFAEEEGYVAREKRFLEEKPWQFVDGMTPEAAVAKFRELGW